MSRVVTWTSENDGAIARIETAMPGKQGKTVLGWLPVVIHAADEATARSKAEAFYQAELTKYANRAEGKAARIAKAQATRQAKAVQS